MLDKALECSFPPPVLKLQKFPPLLFFVVSILRLVETKPFLTLNAATLHISPFAHLTQNPLAFSVKVLSILLSPESNPV